MKNIILGLSAMVLIATATTLFINRTSGTSIELSSTNPEAPPNKTLKAFGSDTELKTFLAGLKTRASNRVGGAATGNTAPTSPASTDSAKAEAGQPGLAKGDESITNNQHAGVDEGGIVKMHGDFLIVLRRGRLFTVAVGDDRLKPVSVADAFGGEIDPQGTWYDEMLISGDTIAVIGYSYSRGGTEVGLFQIDGRGNLTYRSTYHLKSNDYYSSRNYASRMIDGKLIFYSPFYLPMYGDDPYVNFPAIRKWHRGAKASEFTKIIPTTQIYNGVRNPDTVGQLALHTVTACDIDGGEMSCKATGVIGPPGNVFYVSAKNVYVWASDWYGSGASSMLYNLPLDGSSPSALGVAGSPVDQFSFLEGNDGYLNVLVRANGTGTGMWRSEVSSGDVALMRVRTDSFADCNQAVPESSYRALPKPNGYTFQNRFVGNHLLYGTGSGWLPKDKRDGSILYVANLDGGKVSELELPHGVDRIEALGSNAIVVGTVGTDLDFTTVRLGSKPKVADRKVINNASQGELRSHGFFYKPDGTESGVLGLPVSQAGRAGYEHLFNGSASISFFRNESLQLTEIGKLNSSHRRAADDHCRASCVDWYGNARPIFAKGRIFALLGYELVEGEISDGEIYELRRANFAPVKASVARQVEEE